MTRTIKASEIKPGMEVEFTLTRKMMIHKVITWGDSHRELRDDTGHVARVDADAPVTVLSEPAPPQPEEPRWVAARAKLRDYRFFRVDESDRPWRKADCMGRVFPYRYSWRDVCSLGPVTVIPDQGWTVPADAPEVPERIEVWPEDDTALRPYKWRGRDGYIWKWLAAASEWECYDAVGNGMVSGGRPSYGPWTRETDA